jgi:hypothetical protein
MQKAVYRALFISVMRKDQSFSYAVVERGDLVGDTFVGPISVRFPNGELGDIQDSRGTIDLFITKKGTTESVSIIDRLIGGIVLPDSAILPVKFKQASVREGRLVGDFQLFVFADKKKISGKCHEAITAVDVKPS